MRIEYDLIGEVVLEDDVYYGAQTWRALHLCNPSKEKLKDYPEIVKSMAIVKKGAALANKELKVLDKKVANAICIACDEIIDGKFQNQFPVDIFAGGGGVSIHMNINEVIANRANEILTGKKGYELVHPNTHVNMGQSTNDVLPSAMKLSTYYNLIPVVNVCREIQKIANSKCEEFAEVVKLSRTCMQDAMPITMGQYLGGFKTFLKRQADYLETIAYEALTIPLGATAVGTGLGSFKGYRQLAVKNIALISGLDVKSDEDLFDALQNADFYVKASAALKSLAFGISKISRDIRILSSGPRGGINEISIEAVQHGSSIMPGKVNPTIPELMNMVAYQIAGNDVSINMACEGGELELNVWEAINIINLFSSCKLLADTIPVFAEKCLASLTVNYDVCRKNVENSLALATIISTMFGYEKGCQVARYATEKDIAVKSAAIELGLLDEQTAEKILDPLMLCDPEKSGKLLASFKKKENIIEGVRRNENGKI